MFTSISRLLVACTLLALSSLSLEATQIIWQSARAAHESSTGQALDNYIFELDIFTESFVPTPFNVSEWANNWQAADRVRYDAINRAFTSRIDIKGNGAPSWQESVPTSEATAPKATSGFSCLLLTGTGRIAQAMASLSNGLP